eukprot:scaffold31_cov263-Pinguiococcus_pyrenoidosus.AAC.29
MARPRFARALSTQLSVVSNGARPLEREVEQKALADTFGRFHDYLRISLTERCNLRCVYCMPEEGVPVSPSGKLLTTDEVLQLADMFTAAGVRKVRLTGGEPTLRRDLPDILAGMRDLRSELTSIGITTNAILLTPEKLRVLRDAGLTHLNVSLDTLHADRFEKITRRKGTPWDAARAARQGEGLSSSLRFAVTRSPSRP